MIEDPEAVEEIDPILDVPGVDAVFIGQGDLTQTLGDREQAQVLVDKALARCLARGMPAAPPRTATMWSLVSIRASSGWPSATTPAHSRAPSRTG